MSPSVYAERRARLCEAIGPDGVAVFAPNPESRRSHDTYYEYRPSSDIVYLTGFEEPESVLVVAPGHDDGDFFLFVRPRDAERELWDGYRAGVEGAKSDYGANEAHTTDELDEVLPRYLQGRQALYYTLGEHAEFDTKIARWMNQLRHRRRAPSAAPRALIDARDVVHEMRLRKRPEELQAMREAARISAEAHVLAMRATRPGVSEFEVQSVIEHHFRSHGANAPAYASIVGGGANATVLHYITNRDALKAGDVLLIDAGCEYDFYAADITRSFPVSGKFTAEQRDVYQAVLEVQKAAIEDVSPGARYSEFHDNTVRRISQALLDLGVLTGELDQVIEESTYKAYYPHGVGHWLGMDVHDVGAYHDADGEWRRFEPGMAVTVEPGLYFPANAEVREGFRGLGIRIEDDIVVTSDGYENITAACPKEIDEIEAIVGKA